MAVLELSTPGKRSLFEAECMKYGVDCDKFFNDVEQMVNDYEYTLGEKHPRGFAK